jgi:hypothetical protein
MAITWDNINELVDAFAGKDPREQVIEDKKRDLEGRSLLLMQHLHKEAIDWEKSEFKDDDALKAYILAEFTSIYKSGLFTGVSMAKEEKGDDD